MSKKRDSWHIRRISYLVGILFAVITALELPQAAAQQPIPGNYAPGAATGMKGSIMAPPNTFIFENATMHFYTRDFVDSSGNKTSIPTSNALANRTILGYVFDTDILGADFFPAVIIPLANQYVRPTPDSEKDFQFGDIILQPVALGWHLDEWHPTIAYNLWLPTGRFNEGENNNTGKGLVSHLIQVGVTWLQTTELPWSWTVIGRYELFGTQEDTDIRPGQVLTIDGGAGKEVIKGFDLGVTGYFTTQTTRESGSAPGTDTSRYRTFGVGPEINWRPSFMPEGSNIGFRSYWEFESQNLAQGVFSILSIAVPIAF